MRLFWRRQTLPEETPVNENESVPAGDVTVLFTDIEGSTEMAERLGDRALLRVLRDHSRIVSRAVRAHEGSIVKSQGDGFMIVFGSARAAVRCALAVQEAVERYNSEHPGRDLRVRAGLHTGEVIVEGDDFFGMNVILAARIVAQAAGGEVLVSGPVRELTAATGDFQFDEGMEVVLKGLRGSHRLYRARPNGRMCWPAKRPALHIA